MKNSIHIYSEKLTNIFNECLINGKFPDTLKRADVTPIFKKGKDNEKENYRLMSMLSTFSKVFGKTFDEVTRKPQNDFLILDEWFFNNILVLNSDKCHFMTLGTPNTLPRFKCKNITIKNSASEKLLGVIMDNKLDFTEHLNTVCKKANLKLLALNRISRFFSPEQHLLIINAYIKSLLNYCPLVWMFCYRRIMHKMNKIHERSLRLLLKNYKDDFQDLLRSSGDISIHQKCINSLLTEVYKYIHGLSPEIMNVVFST